MAEARGEDIIRSLTTDSLETLALEYRFSADLVKRIATVLNTNSSVTTITITGWASADFKRNMAEGFVAIVAAAENNYNITSCTAIGRPDGRYKEPAVNRQVNSFTNQMCEIVKRNLERCYLVTVTVLDRQSDGLRVSCSSLGGDEVAVLTVGRRHVASAIYNAVSETQAELLQDRRLMLLLTDGSTLQITDSRPLMEVFTRKEDILEIFRKFDGNDDGIISVDELRVVMKAAFKESVGEAELQQLFGAMDIDKDGNVSTSDFLEFIFKSGDDTDVAALMNVTQSCQA
eukprot:TRINITY_DN82472_c0_g1_i1.p1 TRINITY_DN82472_c0_g1~~TRINITY_DN82472_c0_g1_i1.p1  ORF type:complete len:314 (+),score=55.44 TRINITY_DN82472_c0_g1_i1:81-944(+)